MSRPKSRLVAVIAAMAAIGLAACDGDGADKAAKGEGIGASGGGAAAEEARVAADRAVAAQGTFELRRDVTIGVLHPVVGAEIVNRAQAVIDHVTKRFGWKVVTCNGQGDPTKWATCATSLVNQDVDVLFDGGLEPALIAAGLQQAKRKGIPVFSFGAAVAPDPNLTGNYGPDPKAMGRKLGEYLVEKIGSGDVLRFTYPLTFSAQADDAMMEVFRDGGPKVVATKTPNVADLVGSTRQQVGVLLRQHPDAKALVVSLPVAIQPAAQTVAAERAKRGKGPIVVTYSAELGTQDLIRQGAVDAAVDYSVEASVFTAIDSAALVTSGGKPNPAPGQVIEGFELYDYPLVTKSDLPERGQYVKPDHDFVAFFYEKWKKQFGVDAAG